MIKKTLGFLLVVLAGVLIWASFALWTGIYSIYSYPPSKEHPDGKTYIVSREEWEPMFNSPDYKPPKHEEKKSSGGLQFQSAPKAKRPIEQRIVFTFPFYVEWFYTRSLKPQKVE
jgi:hypothetical protein